MLQANLSNPDVVRIANRVERGEINHRILADIIGKASKWKLSPKQVSLICNIEREQDARRNPTSVNVGSLSALTDLLKRAKQHLKYPKFRVATEDGDVVVSMAGDNSRHRGSLYVKSPGGYYDATYYGRVNPDTGEWVPSRDAEPMVGDALKKFSADPAGVAAEYGRLHGNCCFCSRPLSDERSTQVGYGETCAGHYGLPWGAK